MDKFGDPYGVEDLSEEYQCIGRNYFARLPGSDVCGFRYMICRRSFVIACGKEFNAGDFDREDDLSWLL